MIDLSVDLSKIDYKNLLRIFRDSSGKLRDKIREIIIQRIEKNKPFVSINEKETQHLYKIRKYESYRMMEICLGSHWSMNLIGLGLLVSELNETQKTDLQEKVRIEVHRKYGAKGLKILEMGSTGVIRDIIDYLSRIKTRKEYTFLEMNKLFDNILDKWQKMAIFVKSEDDMNHIKMKCRQLLESKDSLFFVFAYGFAVKHAINAIASLNNDGELKGYLFFANMGTDGKRNIYSCSFENVEGFGIDSFI